MPDFPSNWLIAQDFDPNDNLMSLKGKDYLNVQNRLIWFIRDQRALIAARLATVPFIAQAELVQLDLEKGFALFKATVRDVLGNEATNYGSETAKDFGDYIEKAATKALGRSLADVGYGTQFAPELDEGDRVVDAPTERKPTPKPAPKPTPPPVVKPAPQPVPQLVPVSPAPVLQVVPEEPVDEEPAERVGMNEVEKAKFFLLVKEYGKDFMQLASVKAGWVKDERNTGVTQKLTESQISDLFVHVEQWYSEWQAEQQPIEPQEQPAETPEEPAEEPVVDEIVRYKEQSAQLIEMCKLNEVVNTTLYTRAMQLVLEQVPTPDGTKLSVMDQRKPDGKQMSIPALMALRNIPLKDFNDTLEHMIAGDDEMESLAIQLAPFMEAEATKAA